MRIKVFLAESVLEVSMCRKTPEASKGGNVHPSSAFFAIPNPNLGHRKMKRKMYFCALFS